MNESSYLVLAFREDNSPVGSSVVCFNNATAVHVTVKIGNMLAYTALDDKSTSVLITHVQDFLRWAAALNTSNNNNNANNINYQSVNSGQLYRDKLATEQKLRIIFLQNLAKRQPASSWYLA